MNPRKGKITTRIAQALAVALVAATAFAVHDMSFELDGNIINDVSNPKPVDWASLYDVSGTSVPTAKASQPASFGTPVFFRDFVSGATSDTTTFATGSKDIQNISGGGTTNGSWQCSKANNISDKTDLLNAYATTFTAVNGDTIVYFGAETASNEGTRDVGFW